MYKLILFNEMMSCYCVLTVVKSNQFAMTGENLVQNSSHVVFIILEEQRDLVMLLKVLSRYLFLFPFENNLE